MQSDRVRMILNTDNDMQAMMDIAKELSELSEARDKRIELERRIAGARQIHVKADDAVRCLMCDTKISRERLDAIPSVNTCTDCARDIERAARMVA